MPIPLVDVLIDWNADSDFSDTGEDVSTRVRVQPGMRLSRGRDQIRSLAPPAAGSATVTLQNASGDYSSQNSGSPLAGNLLPGRTLRVRGFRGTRYNYNASLAYNAVGVPYNGSAENAEMWRGPIDDIQEDPSRMAKTVTLPALGTLSRLRRKLTASDVNGISTALYQSITTDVALGYVLDAISWPAADRVLDTGKTTLLWWWLQDADPWDAMVAILNTEGPGTAIYEDGQGRIHFESRHYRLLTARCTAVQATFRDTGAEPLHSEPFSINPNLKDIINACQITVKTRSTDALGVVWTLGETVTLAPNEVRAYIATNTDPFTAAVTPVNATDYTVTTGSLSSVVLNRTSGQSCTITLTAGSSGATVTGLQLRAQTVTVDNTIQVAETIDVTTSQNNHGYRPYVYPVREEISTNVAQDFCNAIVSAYQSPRPVVQITVIGSGADRLTQILNREISDRIHIVEARSYVDHPYFLEQIALESINADPIWQAVFGAEKAQAGADLTFVLDSATNGVLNTNQLGF